MEDPRRAAQERRRVPACGDPLPRRLGHGQPHRRLADEPIEQAQGVRAAADAGDRQVGQPPFDPEQLGRRLVADDALEVAHEHRIRVRAHRRAEAVVRGLDVGDPVAQGLADGILERSRAAVDRPHLRAQGLHPQDVRGLAADVLDAHVDDARDLQQSAGGGRGHAVHAGAGLGDDAALAEAPGQQHLAQGVVELVSARCG